MCPKWEAQRVSLPRFRKFILLVSFSGTLLVVSVLSMIAICSSFCCPGGVINSSCGNYEGRLVGSVQSGDLSVEACLAFQGSFCW